jgi:hypothetical protein
LTGRLTEVWSDATFPPLEGERASSWQSKSVSTASGESAVAS